MIKSEFQYLQMRAAASGMTLKSFIQAEGVAYSTYNHWCRKVYYSSAILKVMGKKNQLATSAVEDSQSEGHHRHEARTYGGYPSTSGA